MAFILLTETPLFAIIYIEMLFVRGVYVNIAIVDDIQKETAEFTDAVREYGALNRTEIEVTSFVSAEEFISDYFPLKYTLIVLDIYMDGMNGLEAAGRIKELDRNALIVFLSSSEEHYPDALRLHAFDFLNKPASKERIFGLLDDITAKTTEVIASLEFVCEKKTIRLPYDHIASVSASGHYSEISGGSNDVYKTRMPYTAVYGTLSGDKRFLEINRGTAVNLDMIVRIDEDGVCHLKNGTSLPVNVKNSKTIKQTWQNYMFDRLRDETRRRK